MRIDRSHCYIPELLLVSACKSTRYNFKTKKFDSHPYRVHIELRIHFLAIAIFRLIDAAYHLLWGGMYFVLRLFTFVLEREYQDIITMCMKENLNFSKKQLGLVIEEIKDGVFFDPEKSLKQDLLRLTKPALKSPHPLKRTSSPVIRRRKRLSNEPIPSSSTGLSFQALKRCFKRS